MKNKKWKKKHQKQEDKSINDKTLRKWVNDLVRAISKGDEVGAASAAVNLARERARIQCNIVAAASIFEAITLCSKYLPFQTKLELRRVCRDWNNAGKSGLFQSVRVNSPSLSSKSGLLALKNLKRLSVTHCDWLDDTTLLQLLNNSPQIEELGLEHCSGISAAGFRESSKKCDRLKVISLAGCDQLVGSNTSEAIIGCSKFPIETLNLSELAVESATLTILAVLPWMHLQSLDLSNSACIEAQLKTLLEKKGSQLTSLSLAKNNWVSNKSVENIGQCCNNCLKELDLSDTRITDEGLNSLLLLSKLEVLKLNDSEVSAHAVVKTRMMMSKIKIFEYTPKIK